MLIKIPIENAAKGMFVHKIICSWWAHPFWRRQMMLQSEDQLVSLQQSGAKFIVIDDEKGVGFPFCPSMNDRAETFMPADPKIRLTRAVSGTVNALTPTHRSRNNLTPSQRRAEIVKARGTLNRSKLAVMQMFGDARMGKAIQIRKMASMVNQLTASVDKDPAIILNMARLKTKDDYTYMHSVSVCALMINLARTMRLNEALVREAGMAGLLHDVGKIAIPNDILLKPTQLNDAEVQIVRDHPLAGYRILSASDGVSAAALDVCLHHHEKMDGSGYPDKLNGEELQLLTRMAAICDVYDAVTSQRSYNNPWAASDALAKMQSWRGHFDQIILRSFVESLGILPVGTLVRLTNDHLAIVKGETSADYSLPQLRIFYSVASSSETAFYDLEISRSAHSWQISSVEDPRDWGFDDWPSLQLRLLAKEKQSGPTISPPSSRLYTTTDLEHSATELEMGV